MLIGLLIYWKEECVTCFHSMLGYILKWDVKKIIMLHIESAVGKDSLYHSLLDRVSYQFCWILKTKSTTTLHNPLKNDRLPGKYTEKETDTI